MRERRKVRRGRYCLEGEIVLDDRCSTFDCLVTDLSGDGARLHLPSTAGVPGEFDLVLLKRGESHRARLVWRDETQAGVTFVPASR